MSIVEFWRQVLVVMLNIFVGVVVVAIFVTY